MLLLDTCSGSLPSGQNTLNLEQLSTDKEEEYYIFAVITKVSSVCNRYLKTELTFIGFFHNVVRINQSTKQSIGCNLSVASEKPIFSVTTISKTLYIIKCSPNYTSALHLVVIAACWDPSKQRPCQWVSRLHARTSLVTTEPRNFTLFSPNISKSI